MKNFAQLILFLLLMFCAACLIVHLTIGSAPKTLAKKEHIFIIEPGETASHIAYTLKKKHLIRSRIYFSLWTRLLGVSNKIQAGTYLIPAQTSTLGIIKLLVTGEVMRVSVTVAEGLTSTAVADLFVQAHITTKEEFLAAVHNPALLSEFHIPFSSAEGFLFPDTYSLPCPYPAEKIVRMMLQAFFDNLHNIDPQYQKLSAQELHRKVTLASIVEKEYRVPEEAAKIASVFFNRLDCHMPLQSCATVIYVLTEILGRKHPKRLFYQDLEIDNPYNTYQNKGLPPGPIANPGRIALCAAFHPAQTDYLFFVVQDAKKGTHLFTNNATAHEAGRQRYVETYFAY